METIEIGSKKNGIMRQIT